MFIRNQAGQLMVKWDLDRAGLYQKVSRLMNQRWWCSIIAYLSTPSLQEVLSQMHRVADERGFIVVSPHELRTAGTVEIAVEHHF